MLHEHVTRLVRGRYRGGLNQIEIIYSLTESNMVFNSALRLGNNQGSNLNSLLFQIKFAIINFTMVIFITIFALCCE